MFRKSAVVLALLLLSLSYRLYALGLGEIEMHSALNQPMSADISLISATSVDLSEVKIALASRASHERLGLSRAKILSDFSFAITEDSRGRPFIHISSTELVHEPYLEFLIEMVWQNGQMVREYTVLVDPPVTMQARPAVPVAPVARAPQPAPVIAEPVRQAWPAPAPRPVRPAYIPAPVEKQAVQHYGQVRRDDTLWSLAENLRPSTDISIEQMMIALQTANPDAFGDNNINNLHAGVTLKVPDRDAILALSKRQARAEARRQNREWNDKRNAANAVTKQPVAEMPVREEEMPVQQDGAVVETEAQLKLTPPEGEMVAGSASGSEAGDTDSGASGDGNIRQQLVLASEEIEAGRAESEELQSRVQELEGQVQNMQRLLELKSEELAGMQNEPGEQVAEAVVSEEMPAGEEQQSAEEAEVEAELAAAEDSPVTEPRSIVDRLMDNPVLAGLGVLIAMLLGGFLWGSMRKHRSQGLYDDEMTLDKHLTKAGGDVASSTGLNISDPGEFDEGSPDEMESHASDDVNDPVTEADVYLAYGRIQQAEDVLQAALQDDPENVAIRSKLLKVYHTAGNATAFNSAAGEFRELVGDDDGQWQRIAAMGNELSPGNELYRPETETLTEQDNVVEFDMDLSEPGDASPQAGEIAEADAAVQELDMAMGTETVDDAVQELEMATETDETEILPESIEFTLDDEDEYENEAEGLLASADEVATKLDLARAYLDMEDPDGARSILQEVIDEGDEEQKSEAQSLISKIA